MICSNGKQVVEAFEESEPDQYDAVLMDVQIPVMNGYEASEGSAPAGDLLEKRFRSLR